ncbi:peptide-methionine (R)-S-oxide reductase MsrB [Tautonia sp. JC769]|uniref:peptide-methionine (R)-S-oxide reductase MsrB n=1 Tax=Tautonia sp. JC769 TaxID=3232135 RepID=UPI0034583AC5
MTTRFLAVGAAVLVLAALAAVRAGGDEPKRPQAPGQSASTSKTTPTKGTRVMKSDAEWRQILTDQEFYVTRRKGTEPAFSNRYWNHHGDGYYRCVCCNTVLFDSKTKFESGTGWPSFYAPVSKAVVKTETDRSGFMIRTEVLCRVCDAHLGHVFKDGPRPTGLRFCMNSASLKFQGRAEAEAEAAAQAVLESAPSAEAGDEPASDTGTDPESEPKPGDAPSNP